MKKIFLSVVFIFLFIFPLISSANLEIEQKTSDVAMILGLDMPAIFDLEITNLGESDYFMFYNFFGSDIFPKGTVLIKDNKKIVDLNCGGIADIHHLAIYHIALGNPKFTNDFYS